VKENTPISDIEPGFSNQFPRHRIDFKGRMRFAGRFHIKALDRTVVLPDTFNPRARKHGTLCLSDITQSSQWGSVVWQSVHTAQCWSAMNCKCCIG
jgi:hypothetical protein